MYKLILFSFFTLIFLSPIKANAFIDDFTTNPTLGTSWLFYKQSSIAFNNPGITTSSYNSNSYPYLVSNENLSSNRYFSVDFQYLESSPWGVAVVFTDNAPTYGPILYNISDYVDKTMFSVWGSTLLSQSTICPVTTPVCAYGRWTIYPNSIPSLEDTSMGITNLDRHKIEIQRTDLPSNEYVYEIFLDNKLISTTSKTSRVINKIWIGNPQILGQSSNWPKLRIYSVQALPERPTLTPTFPYFSQLDPKWKNEEYDSASKWAGIDKFGIGRWGCALTSAAMVLQKNGIKSLDGTEIDPSKLNTWLKSQPDGYVGLGYLNWIALTRYVRLSHEAGHSPTKLEFTRTGVPSFPSIIGLPGHFVVVHGEDGNNWLVNDPANASTTTLPKSTALKSVNTFVPSMTDMSYMLFAADPKLQIELKKEHLKRFAIDWSNESLIEQIDQGTSPETKIGMISKPKSGEYELKVSNPTNDKLNFDIYLYDVNGNPWIKKIAIYKNSSVKFEIKYNRDKVSKSKLEHEKRYRYMRNRLKKIIEKIWDEHDRWEERSEN